MASQKKSTSVDAPTLEMKKPRTWYDLARLLLQRSNSEALCLDTASDYRGLKHIKTQTSKGSGRMWVVPQSSCVGTLVAVVMMWRWSPDQGPEVAGDMSWGMLPSWYELSRGNQV